MKKGHSHGIFNLRHFQICGGQNFVAFLKFAELLILRKTTAAKFATF